MTKLKGEVVPAIYLLHEKPPGLIKRQRLETILEEGSGSSNRNEVLPRRILCVVPVVLSFFSYFLLYRHVVAN